MKNVAIAEKIKNFAYLIGCLATIFAFFCVYRLILTADVLPIRNISLFGPHFHVSAERVQHELDDMNRFNFFTLDLSAIQQKIQSIPWVSSASVRRYWPDTLQIDFDEHVAVARWNDNALLNFQGHVFYAENASDVEFNHLPLISGPDALKDDIWHQYNEIQTQLKVIARSVQQLSVSERLSWTVTLDNGLEVRFGREKLEKRLALLVEMYPKYIEPEQQNIMYIDFRYDFGYSIGWKASDGDKQNNNKERV